MKRDAVDFHEVRPEHADIHARLLNWARWCSGGRRGYSMHPMFIDYRADGYHEASAGIPLDSMDGHAVEKMVIAMPEKHRTILQWWYVRPYIPPHRVRQALGLTSEGLVQMTHDARTMLKNRALRDGGCTKAKSVLYNAPTDTESV